MSNRSVGKCAMQWWLTRAGPTHVSKFISGSLRSPIRCNVRLLTTNPPTSPHITQVVRPKRPDFLKDGQAHYEIAASGDKQLVLDWMIKYFLPDGPLQPGVHATKEDVYEWYADIIEPCLVSGFSILGFDGDNLLAIQLTKQEEIPKDSVQLRDEDISSLPFNYLKPDYAEDIAKGPYRSVKANQMYVFLHELQRDWTKLFPPGSKAVSLELSAVIPQARRRHLAWEMGYAGIRLAAEAGCVGALVTPIAAEVKAMGDKEKGWKMAREIFFKDFKANGEPVFNLQTSGQIRFGMFKELKLDRKSAD